MSPEHIVNLYRIDPENLGDQACSPTHYFPDLRQVRTSDINGSEIPHADAYIVGGGGLLHGIWPSRIASLIKRHATLIAWGIGCNIHNTTDFIWPKFLDDFDLVGLRDWNNPWAYVPCPSCMHPALYAYRQIAPRYRFVIYEHYEAPIPIINTEGLRLSNRQPFQAFPDVLRHLALGEIVISNTFHGIYWAMLLNRKALCFRPYSNRFYCFKNNPVYCDTHDWQEKLETANNQPEYFMDCRRRNIAFYNQVTRTLSLRCQRRPSTATSPENIATGLTGNPAAASI